MEYSNSLLKSPSLSSQECGFNVFGNTKSSRVDRNYNLYQMMHLIKKGGDHLLFINALKGYCENQKEYTEIKSNLPLVSWNVVFDKKRSKKTMKSMSGYMYFEKSDMYPEEIGGFKNCLKSSPMITAVWKLAVGRGVGCLVRVCNVTPDNFIKAWNKIDRHMGMRFDMGSRRLMLTKMISYDPDLYVKHEAESYEYVDWNSTSPYGFHRLHRHDNDYESYPN
jgi:hypothetical protein